MILVKGGTSSERDPTEPTLGSGDNHVSEEYLTTILRILSDGRVHQSDTLREACLLTTQQLEDCLARCESMGLQVVSPEPGCLQWITPVELLDRAAVAKQMVVNKTATSVRLEFPFSCGSTNTYVSDLLALHPGATIVAATEYQTSGRGTRGREWQSRAASGLCFSVAMEWPGAVRLDSSLTLSAGVAVASSLSALSDAPVMLKWPNDLIVGDAKLGGILVETSTTANNTLRIIIGVGLNINHNPESLHQSDALSLPATSLIQHCTTVPNRNTLLAEVLTRLLSVCETYRQGNKSSLIDAYTPYDYLRSRSVQVIQEHAVQVGTAQGINEEGALLVEVDGKLHTLVSGEVRVRKV